MKTRHGFVSNSSSSSFIVRLSDITALQLDMIQNHSEEGRKLGISWSEDAWSISVAGDLVSGWTHMDNFDMHDFFRQIGIPEGVVVWDEDNR